MNFPLFLTTVAVLLTHSQAADERQAMLSTRATLLSLQAGKATGKGSQTASVSVFHGQWQREESGSVPTGEWTAEFTIEGNKLKQGGKEHAIADLTHNWFSLPDKLGGGSATFSENRLKFSNGLTFRRQTDQCATSVANCVSCSTAGGTTCVECMIGNHLDSSGACTTCESFTSDACPNDGCATLDGQCTALQSCFAGFPTDAECPGSKVRNLLKDGHFCAGKLCNKVAGSADEGICCKGAGDNQPCNNVFVNAGDCPSGMTPNKDHAAQPCSTQECSKISVSSDVALCCRKFVCVHDASGSGCKTCGSKPWTADNYCATCNPGFYADNGVCHASTIDGTWKYCHIITIAGENIAYGDETNTITDLTASEFHLSGFVHGASATYGANGIAFPHGVTYKRVTGCLAGQTANADHTACQSCTDGTQSAAGGSCNNCLAGQTSNVDHTTCQSCADGEKSAAGGSCSKCPAGHTSNADHTACQSCADGWQSAAGGSCTQCPAGQTSNAEHTACQSCDSGTQSAAGGTCDQCPDGQTSNVDHTGCVPDTPPQPAAVGFETGTCGTDTYTSAQKWLPEIYNGPHDTLKKWTLFNWWVDSDIHATIPAVFLSYEEAGMTFIPADDGWFMFCGTVYNVPGCLATATMRGKGGFTAPTFGGHSFSSSPTATDRRLYVDKAIKWEDGIKATADDMLWKMMKGHGVNTVRFVNKLGEIIHYCKIAGVEASGGTKEADGTKMRTLFASVPDTFPECKDRAEDFSLFKGSSAQSANLCKPS